MFAFEPGALDYGFKDDEGKVLSEEALMHMSLNRINCPKCSKIFCFACKAQPYHLGRTCEQQKQYQESAKCRFCEAAIPVVDG